MSDDLKKKKSYVLATKNEGMLVQNSELSSTVHE